MTIEQLRSVSRIDFGYNRESVKWLEGYIERIKKPGVFDEAAKGRLISMFGSFLGECIIHCYGGAWQQRDGSWCVAFDEKNVAFPFGKVSKQFDNGLEDSVFGFFDVIPIVFAGSIQFRSLS